MNRRDFLVSVPLLGVAAASVMQPPMAARAQDIYSPISARPFTAFDTQQHARNVRGYWRSGCGSFVSYGAHGAVGDWVTEAMLMVTDGQQSVKSIICGIPIVRYFAHTFAWHRSLRHLPQEKAAEVDQAMHIGDFLIKDIRFRGARVGFDREMNAGEMRMFRDEYPRDHNDWIALLSGWTA